MEYNIGLVLSGGGTKGAAHVGVIKAMEELGVEAEVVSGTSAGAIVGAMYAAGIKADDMLAFFTSVSVFKFSHYTWKKPGFIDAASFKDILEERLGVKTYEELKKPLFVVATDILKAREKIFNKGPLALSIVASAAFPVVFAPVEMNGTMYSDGGILNNFPTEPIRPICKDLIGIHVQNISHVGKDKMKSTFSVFQRIYSIVTRYDSTSKYIDCDVLIAPDSLQKYNTFDMYKIKEMYQIGYEAGLEQIGNYLKVNLP